MCRIHIADQSDKAPATKGIEAWKYYRYNHYRGYNHVPNIVLSVNGLSASQLMTTTVPPSGMANRNLSVCRLLSVSMSRYRRTSEKNHCRRLSRVSTIIAATLSTTLSKTRTEILTSEIRVRRPWGYRRSFLVPTFRRLLPHHATYSIANLSTPVQAIFGISAYCV